MASNNEQFRKAKDQIAQLEAELAEFQASSHELERELELELEESEERHKKSELIINKLTIEINDWKEKYRDLQKEYSTSTLSFQREIKSLHDAHNKSNNRLREIEMTNDDMERNERITKSTLEDMEQKYHSALEQVAMMEAELASRDEPKAQIQRLKDELRDTTEELSVANLRIQKLTNQIEIQNEHIKKTSALSKSRNPLLSVPRTYSPKPFDAKDSRLSKKANGALGSETDNQTNSTVPPLSSSRSLRKIHGMLDQMKMLESRVAHFKSSLPLPATPTSATQTSRYAGSGMHVDTVPRSSPPRQPYNSNTGYGLENPRRHERQTSRGPMSPVGIGSNIPILKARNQSTSSFESDFDSDSAEEYTIIPSIEHTLDTLPGKIPRTQVLQSYQNSNTPPSPTKTPEDTNDAESFESSKHESNHSSKSKSSYKAARSAFEVEKENRSGGGTLEISKIRRPGSSLNIVRPSSRSTQRTSHHERANSFIGHRSANIPNEAPVASKHSRNATLSFGAQINGQVAGHDHQQQQQHGLERTPTSASRHARGTSVSRGMIPRPGSSQGSYAFRNRSSVDFHSSSGNTHQGGESRYATSNSELVDPGMMYQRSTPSSKQVTGTGTRIGQSSTTSSKVNSTSALDTTNQESSTPSSSSSNKYKSSFRPPSRPVSRTSQHISKNSNGLSTDGYSNNHHNYNHQSYQHGHSQSSSSSSHQINQQHSAYASLSSFHHSSTHSAYNPGGPSVHKHRSVSSSSHPRTFQSQGLFTPQN